MENNRILLIETATDSCSVALSDGERLTAEKYSAIPKAHDTLLAKISEEILEENGLKASDLGAVAVSSGPGSYMGLRIAASLAKGIAFGAGIKLIGVGTLAVIAQCALDSALYKMMDETAEGDFLIVPMIDAGRMEVYASCFSSGCEELTKTEAVILTPDSYAEELSRKKVLFTGNGADKFRRMIERERGSVSTNAYFAEQMPHAAGLRVKAAEALKKGLEEDIAYFQPFYLKDFIPGKSKKLL